MKSVQISKKTVLAYLWKIPLCAFAYMAGTMVGGALVKSLEMKLPAIPEQADEKTMGLCLLAACLVLAVGTAPVARRIRARYLARVLILAGLCYICLGINIPIEAAVFTDLEGMPTVALMSILPCVLFAAVTCLLFGPAGKTRPLRSAISDFFSGRSVQQWAWRLSAAVCAFPIIYLIFGMAVSPWVVQYYEQGQFGLHLPPLTLIVLVQLPRSVLFLAAALAIVIVWSGSRRHLAIYLGLAFFVLVGLFSMIQSYWLAPVLLVLHNAEILADSVTYAAVLALLFVPGRTSRFAAVGKLAAA
ncbi:MAG: hypothetical protein ACYTDV_06755 [Planctomycetota bacterium]